MMWRDPTALWLLLAAAALGAFLWRALRSRKTAMHAFAEAALVDRLVLGRIGTRRAAAAVLRIAAIACVIAALAGPRWGFRWEQVRREGIDLIIALDTSRSMLATDVKPNRIERAKLAVLDLVKRLRGDRIGLVAFAGSAFLECPLTLDYAAFERSLRATDVGIIPLGGTSLSHAIDTSLDAFEAREGRHEALILITDGEDHEGKVEDAAKLASERGIHVFTVGIGTTEGDLIPLSSESGFVKDRKGQVIKSRLDEATLEQIASISGGAYVRGLGPSLGLDEVFDEHIAKMETREVGSTLERRYEKRFQIPLALALLLFLVEAVVSQRPLSIGSLSPWRRAARASGDAVDGSRGTGEAGSTRFGPLVLTLVLLSLAPLLVGWSGDGNEYAVEGNRLFDAGQFDAAAEQYRQGLVDAPESLLLQFNLGTALYREGKYDEAAGAFSKVAAAGDNAWIERAAYNWGNTLYQLGAAAEPSDPQAAIAAYEQALVAYRRAMAADPDDTDPKYGHEFVTKALADLRRKLEEQKQQEQDQKQDQQQQDQQQQDQQQQDQQQQNQQQQDQEQQQQQAQPDQQAQQDQQDQQDQQQAPEEQQQQEVGQDREETEDEQQAGEAGAQEKQPGDEKPQSSPAPQEVAAESGAPSEDDMQQQAARAVLDMAGSEELDPEDVDRELGVAGVGAPSKDW